MGRANLSTYDSIEFTVSDGETNYDLDAEEAGAFVNAKPYNRITIRANKSISIKLNSSSNAGITVGPEDSPFVIDYLEITNIYITNASGVTASVKIIGTE